MTPELLSLIKDVQPATDEEIDAWLEGKNLIRYAAVMSLIARIVAEREAGTWQDISTAPKDGSRVLTWIEPTKIAVTLQWRWGRWHGDDFPLNMAEPTHWQPLPAPPALSALEERG